MKRGSSAVTKGMHPSHFKHGFRTFKHCIVCEGYMKLPKQGNQIAQVPLSGQPTQKVGDEANVEKKQGKLKKEDSKGTAQGEKQGPFSTKPTFSVDGGDSPRGKREVPSPEGRIRVISGVEGKEEEPKDGT